MAPEPGTPEQQLTPEIVLAALGDARLPTGAQVQSAGLQAAVEEGLSVDQVGDFARQRLGTVVATDAGTAVVARHVWRTEGAGPLDDVSAAWSARIPSRPERDAADRLGRAYADLAQRLWPDRLGTGTVTALGGRPDLGYPRPVVLGAIAGATGVPAFDIARLVAYDDVQCLAAAALRMFPDDALDATGWLLDVAGDIGEVTHEVSGLTTAEAIPDRARP